MYCLRLKTSAVANGDPDACQFVKAHPYPSVQRVSLGPDSPIRSRPDYEFFQVLDIIHHREPSFFQVNDGVHDELAGPVKGDVASALHVDHRDLRLVQEI